MTISRRDALNVAADVLARSDWLLVDRLAEGGDLDASENADRIVDLLRHLADGDPLVNRLEALASFLDNDLEGLPIWVPPSGDGRAAAIQAHYDDAARIRQAVEGTWKEGAVPAIVPPPSGATGATTDEPECEDLHTTYAEDGTALVPRDHWGRGCPAEVPVSDGVPTYATGGYVGSGGSIRDTLRAASDRAHALPAYARPTVTRPVSNGGPTLAPPLADFGITRTGDVVGIYDASGEVREEFRPRRTSGPLDPEIHAALVRSVERGRREQRGCGIPDCYCPGDVSHP